MDSDGVFVRDLVSKTRWVVISNMKSMESSGSDQKQAGAVIVEALLADGLLEPSPISEASVHKARSQQSLASGFTGPNAGQVWKSTGTSDYKRSNVVGQKMGSTGPKNQTRSH